MINVTEKHAWESGPITDENIFKAIEFNSIYDEIRYVIEIENIVLDDSKVNQLNEAIENKLKDYALKDHTHPFPKHNHDDRYSKLGHTHDDRYSKLGHTHDDRYALKNHTHSITGLQLHKSGVGSVDHYDTPQFVSTNNGVYKKYEVNFYFDIPISKTPSVVLMDIRNISVIEVAPGTQYNIGSPRRFDYKRHTYTVYSSYIRFYISYINTIINDDYGDINVSCDNVLKLPLYSIGEYERPQIQYTVLV